MTMKNDTIQKHNFDIAKNHIKELSSNVATIVSLDEFQTEGSVFSWNDHNITGNEINELLVSPLQSILINVNSNLESLYSISTEIYKALDSLDNEYIKGILSAVKAAEIASNQASEASEKALRASKDALDATNEAEIAQRDISKTIKALQTTVSVLKSFKEEVSLKLDTLVALSDQTSENKEALANLEVSFHAISDKLDRFIQEAKRYEEQVHFGDIDLLWDGVEENKQRISSLQSQIDDNNLHIKSALAECLKDSGAREDKKIKIAYGIAAASLTISILQLILLLSGVL